MCKTAGCENPNYLGFEFCAECLTADPYEGTQENVSVRVCHRDEDPALFFVDDHQDD